MAKGFQDWDVSVNINAQDLSEIINRPTYGATQSLDYDEAVTTNDEFSLGIVSGKGMMYGGYLYGTAPSAQTVIYTRLYLDDVLISSDTPKFFWNAGIDTPNTSIIYLLFYDPLTFQFTLGFSYGITFESSLEVRIIRHPDVAPSIKLKLLYALI